MSVGAEVDVCPESGQGVRVVCAASAAGGWRCGERGGAHVDAACAGGVESGDVLEELLAFGVVCGSPAESSVAVLVAD